MDPDKIKLVQTDSNIPPEVLEKILPPIEDLLKVSVDINYQGERVLQLLRLERADNFYRGIQNIAPSMDPASGAVGWTTIGVVSGNQNDSEGIERAFDYNPRKTKSYGEKYTAVLGQRPFYDCWAEANDPTSEIDRRGARQVNLLVQMLQGQWNVKVLNMRLFYYLYKTGTTFGFVRPVTDGRKYGYYQVPNIVTEMGVIVPGGYHCQQCGNFNPGDPPNPQNPVYCPQCGAPTGPEAYADPVTGPTPVQRGFNKFPKTSVEMVLLNGYTVTVPFNVVEKDDSPWIINECEKDRGQLLKAHPNAREIVGLKTSGGFGGDASSATAATVRASAQSQTGTVRTANQNLWNYRVIWLESSMFETISDDLVRTTAQQAFPDGVKITQIEGATVKIENQDFRARFSACMPSMADYLFTDGTCWGMLGMEDAWSNLLNIAEETLETGIPTYLTNPEYIDADTMNRMRYSPNRFQDALPRAGETLANAFQMFPTARFPDQIPQMFEVIEDNIQNQLGMLPQVFGQMPANLTLGQARMMLNQGLMQLSVPATLATNFWEQTWTNGVNLYCDVANGNPQFQGQTIDLDLIKRSGWTIKGDSTMPRSFAERKEAIQEMLTTNPAMAQALKLTDPVNIGKLYDYLDIPEMDNPDVNALEALRDIVDQLWQSPPNVPPPPMDPMGNVIGPAGEPEPSIPFDPVVYPPDMAISVAKASLLAPTGQQRQQEPGYANVRAFLQAAMKASEPPPAPPPPPKLSFSGSLDKMPAAWDLAILQKYGIDAGALPLMSPEASPSQHAQTQASQQHAQQQAQNQPPANQPPQSHGPLVAPGAPAMPDIPPGVIQ